MTIYEAPIGIFDSGVGGLTVAKEVFAILPAENIVYFGDVGRSPYGGRSKEIITRFTRQDISFLLEHKVKFIICACNTASSVALEELRPQFEIPMIGVIEPGARAAAERTTNGRIGVIGTNATVGSNAYARCIHEIDPRLKVFSLACPLFVPLAEEGYIEKDATYLIARDYLQTMLDVDIDTLVLGCTHYPLLRHVIADVMGDKITLIDSGEETARFALHYLTDKGLLNPTPATDHLDGTHSGSGLAGATNGRSDSANGSAAHPAASGATQQGMHKFFVSDVPEKFGLIASRFLGRHIDRITRVDISEY